MEITRRRRRAISTALALLLALESVTVVAAAARTSAGQQARHTLPEATPAGLVLSVSGAGEAAIVQAATPVSGAPVSGVPVSGAPVTVRPAAAVDEVPPIPAAVVPAAGAVSAPEAPPSARGTMPERPAKRAASSSAVHAATAPAAPAAPASYAGYNHLWIPALHISRSISAYPCSRTSPLHNVVYRWGCAGTNNLYLMGHAYSVFKPLHDAYVAGHLAVGMKAWFADSKGKVHVYVVRWWKKTRPMGAEWAYAAQGVPSMTLQTCLGANSQFRLVVRLVEVGG